MEWFPALTAFIGGLAGAALTQAITVWHAQRTRRLDAVAEFAGAVAALMQKSFAAMLRGDSADEEWAQFGTRRAHLWMREGRPKQRAQIQLVVAELEQLYSLRVSLDEDVDPEEERIAQAKDHLRRYKDAADALDKLLDMASE